MDFGLSALLTTGSGFENRCRLASKHVALLQHKLLFPCPAAEIPNVHVLIEDRRISNAMRLGDTIKTSPISKKCASTSPRTRRLLHKKGGGGRRREAGARGEPTAAAGAVNQCGEVTRPEELFS